MEIWHILGEQYEHILQVLHLFIFTVDMIKSKRHSRAILEMFYIEVISASNVYLALVSQWLDMLYMYVQYFKRPKRKRHLMKAHLLLQILHGYRLLFTQYIVTINFTSFFNFKLFLLGPLWHIHDVCIAVRFFAIFQGNSKF